jgi:tetratricopeptide (TPR) repeat protein
VDYFSRAVAITRSLNNHWQTSEHLTNLGDALNRQGAFDRAESVLREAVALGRLSEDSGRIAEAQAELAAALTGLGQLEEARMCAQTCLASLRATDKALGVEFSFGVGLALSKLGLIFLREGHPEWAAAAWSESLEHFTRTGERPRIMRGVEQMAYAASALGQHERAARLLGAADGLREQMGIPLWTSDTSDHDRVEAAVRAAIREESMFSALWAEGRAMTHDALLADALQTAAI